MTERDERLMGGLALAACVFMLAEALFGLGAALAYVVPVLLLAVPLLGGRFLGERQLERAARALRARRTSRRPAAPAARPRRTPRLLPRGGRLIAAALAERAPPAAVTA